MLYTYLILDTISDSQKDLFKYYDTYSKELYVYEYFWIIICDGQHGKKALMLYVNSKGPGECTHPGSLMSKFSFHCHILQFPLILYADNEGPDQPAQADLDLHCPPFA